VLKMILNHVMTADLLNDMSPHKIKERLIFV